MIAFLSLLPIPKKCSDDSIYDDRLYGSSKSMHIVNHREYKGFFMALIPCVFFTWPWHIIYVDVPIVYMVGDIVI
jgi:hypothetical protein